MHIHESTKRHPQVIQGVTVQAPHPFEEGHQMTADQASFFNRMLATRIGQTLGQRYKKQAEGAKVDLDTHMASVDAQGDLDKDYASFDFTAQRTPATAADPVAKLARTLAETQLKTLPAIVKIGVGKLMKSKASEGTDYPNKWAQLVADYLTKHPELTDLARQQLDEAKARESENFDDLDLDNLEALEPTAAPSADPEPVAGDEAPAE